MKYLKYFEQASDYEAYKNGSDYVLPNVSFIEDVKDVSYDQYIKPQSLYNMVDLGLPSGLLWADRNIGANNPEDTGLYFAWGETQGYTAEQVDSRERLFTPDSYWDLDPETETYMKYNDSNTLLQPEDDAATVNMGAEYRMPTKADFQELMMNTTWSFIDIPNNRKAVKIASKTSSNYIIIPASEAFFGTLGSSNRTNAGTVWISELLSGYESARCFNFEYNRSMDINANKARFSGVPVRGVCNK